MKLNQTEEQISKALESINKTLLQESENLSKFFRANVEGLNFQEKQAIIARMEAYIVCMEDLIHIRNRLNRMISGIPA